MSAVNSGSAYRRYVLHYYNRFANLYDLGEFIRWRTRRKAMHFSGWKSGERVLDLCTGTGQLALKFAQQGATIVGCDIAWGMLKRAQIKGTGLTAYWTEMDATELAFADDSFDVSVLSLALHHMPENVQVRVLKELRRVTARRIVIIEPDVPIKQSWIPAWLFVASIIDESEYMEEWVRQDLIKTCYTAGLQVESVHSTTFGMHRILSCLPAA